MNADTSPGPWEAAVVAQIDAERAALRMTVSELAKRVGIHPGSMPRYMKGERQLTLALVEKFAAALGIDPLTLNRRAVERQEQMARRDRQSGGDVLDK